MTEKGRTSRETSVSALFTFHLTAGEDGTLEWDPPAGSKALAMALSYHYPLQRGIEGKMQEAIRRFVKEGVGVGEGLLDKDGKGKGKGDGEGRQDQDQSERQNPSVDIVDLVGKEKEAVQKVEETRKDQDQSECRNLLVGVVDLAGKEVMKKVEEPRKDQSERQYPSIDIVDLAGEQSMQKMEEPLKGKTVSTSRDKGSSASGMRDSSTSSYSANPQASSYDTHFPPLGTTPKGELKILRWDPAVKGFKQKATKRPYEEAEKVKVTQNRGFVCETHHRQKKKCDPDKCSQNGQKLKKAISRPRLDRVDTPIAAAASRRAAQMQLLSSSANPALAPPPIDMSSSHGSTDAESPGLVSTQLNLHSRPQPTQRLGSSSSYGNGTQRYGASQVTQHLDSSSSYGKDTQGYGASSSSYGNGTQCYGASSSSYGNGTQCYGASSSSYSKDTLRHRDAQVTQHLDSSSSYGKDTQARSYDNSSIATTTSHDIPLTSVSTPPGLSLNNSSSTDTDWLNTPAFFNMDQAPLNSEYLLDAEDGLFMDIGGTRDLWEPLSPAPESPSVDSSPAKDPKAFYSVGYGYGYGGGGGGGSWGGIDRHELDAWHKSSMSRVYRASSDGFNDYEQGSRSSHRSNASSKRGGTVYNSRQASSAGFNEYEQGSRSSYRSYGSSRHGVTVYNQRQRILDHSASAGTSLSTEMSRLSLGNGSRNVTYDKGSSWRY